ncbi:MAG TPA: hypothetical protein VGK49_10125 [Ilumatobacteraceae bacterium]
MTNARVEWLELGGSAERWRSIGLTVLDDGLVPFMFTSLRIVGGAEGIQRWAISGIADDVTDIDGLATHAVASSAPVLTDHPNGAIELDHVVVATDSLDRTCGAIEAATAAPLRRVRDLGHMRQGFHRVGSGGLIVEVVERRELQDGHASFWGVVVNVADLDAAVELAGPARIGEARDAVQPGRRIATVRGEAGLGLPVALMSPGR